MLIRSGRGGEQGYHRKLFVEPHARALEELAVFLLKRPRAVMLLLSRDVVPTSAPLRGTDGNEP